MTIDINELRRKVNSTDIVDHIDLHANIKPFLSELIDRLEVAEKDAAHQKALADSALRVSAKWEGKCHALRAEVIHIQEKLEAAEKENALMERVIDALGSELNAVANERDALRTVLTDLLNDLEERAKWNLEESQRVVACGNGVYIRAKAALEESK